MPKTVLLHIGTQKTGTTSIQRALAQAQATGALGKVCYPYKPGGSESHNRLSSVYLPFETWSPGLRYNHAATPRAAARIRESYRAFIMNELATASTAILSAELLSHFFPPSAVAQLRDDLESLGYNEFHVILYVRDPAGYYLSLGQERLKHPIDPPLVADPFSFRYPFRAIAETWEQVFPGRLQVRKFADDPHHNVIDDFSTVLQQCLDVSLSKVDVRLNASLSAEGMKILQDYRETFWPDTTIMTPDIQQIFGFLRQSLDVVPQNRPALKPAVADAIRANHRADAEAIRDRYGVDLGLDGHCPAVPASTGQSHRVEDIVSVVDPQIVERLLLLLANAELNRWQGVRSLRRRIAVRSLPRRSVSYVYWSMPRSLRPEGLAARFQRTGQRP